GNAGRRNVRPIAGFERAPFDEDEAREARAIRLVQLIFDRRQRGSGGRGGQGAGGEKRTYTGDAHSATQHEFLRKSFCLEPVAVRVRGSNPASVLNLAAFS